MQSKDYEQLGSLRELHAAADLAKHTPEKVIRLAFCCVLLATGRNVFGILQTPMALGSTPGQTSLQQQDPVHEGIGTLVQRQADADLQEQVNVLETEKVHNTAYSNMFLLHALTTRRCTVFLSRHKHENDSGSFGNLCFQQVQPGNHSCCAIVV